MAFMLTCLRSPRPALKWPANNNKADIMLRRMSKAFSGRTIDTITLFTAPECNLNCPYCFTRERRQQRGHIEFSKWQNVIYQAKEIGARWVVFAGPGEPLLGDISLRLIEYANSLAMRSVIFTNGILVTRDTAQFLYKNNVYTTIKVHSFNPAIYDFLAGKANATEWVDYRYSYKGKDLFHSVPLGLKILLDEAGGLGLKKQKNSLRLESVITKHNLSCLIDVARFAKAHNLGILLETLIVSDDEKIKDLVPVDKEYSIAYNELSKVLGWRFALGQRMTGCGIRQNPVIWENGDMALCFIESASIGNIRANSIRELWATRLKLRERMLQKKNLFGFRNCLGREHTK